MFPLFFLEVIEFSIKQIAGSRFLFLLLLLTKCKRYAFCLLHYDNWFLGCCICEKQLLFLKNTGFCQRFFIYAPSFFVNVV
jgi:hypothetical protein